MTSSRSDSVVSSSEGDSVSGGRKGGVAARIARSSVPARRARVSAGEDMSQAQTLAQAASWPVKLALAPTFDPAFYAELVQFGKVLPWESGIPVADTATT